MYQWQAEEAFDNALNEAYGLVSIAGEEYETAYALRLTDPIVYREAFLSYCDAEGIDTDFED